MIVLIIADLVVLAIIFLSVYIGIKRGFLRTVVGFLSIFISISFAIWTYPIVADVINDTGLKAKINETVEQSLSDTTAKDSEEKTDEKEGFSLLPKSAIDAIDEHTQSLTQTAVGGAAEAISGLAVNIISILLVFVLVRIIMFFVSLLTKFITKLPIIKSIDKCLGAVLGALCGLLVIYLLLTLVTFNSALNSSDSIGKAVKESYIASYMYDNNYIVGMISGK